jgi:hypothetical protein
MLRLLLTHLLSAFIIHRPLFVVTLRPVATRKIRGSCTFALTDASGPCRSHLHLQMQLCLELYALFSVLHATLFLNSAAVGLRLRHTSTTTLSSTMNFAAPPIYRGRSPIHIFVDKIMNWVIECIGYPFRNTRLEYWLLNPVGQIGTIYMTNILVVFVLLVYLHYSSESFKAIAAAELAQAQA